MKQNFEKILFALFRISFGWIFLWAFLDKMFGLGFATESSKAWINGGSPTTGFLKFGTTGPLQSTFEQLAGNTLVDWLYMLGMFYVGIAIITGISRKFASIVGILMMSLIFAAVIPLKNNPIIDEHVIYILIFLVLIFEEKFFSFSLNKWWKETGIVRKFRFLE